MPQRPKQRERPVTEMVPMAETGSKFFDVVEKMNSLYITFRGRYTEARDGRTYIPYQKDTNRPKKLDNGVLIGHLNRRYAIGVYAGSSSSKFVCFDVDMDDIAIVKRIVNVLVKLGFPKRRIYLSTSGGKGYHVELFFTDLMYTSELRNLYGFVCEQANLDPHKVEFRPTSGQSIKLPLSVHPKTGNVCWYLDQETYEPIETIDYVLEIEPIDRDWAVELLRLKIQISYLRKTPKPVAQTVEHKSFDITHFENEYPNMTGTGQMNHLMVSIGVHERYRNTPKEEIANLLALWAERQNPEYLTDSYDSIISQANHIAEWVWSDGFAVSGQSRKLTIYKEDVEWILHRNGARIGHKILFLILFFTKRYGCAKVSIDRMTEYIGCPVISIKKSLLSLYLADCFIKQQGRYDSEMKRAQCNTYRLRQTPSKKVGGSYELEWDFKPETFFDAYVQCITNLLSEKEQEKLLKKTELEEIQNGKPRTRRKTGISQT